MAVAVLAFCLLRTVVAAWYAGVDASSPVRLVTRNSVSLMFPLPLAYLPKIQAVPDIVRVAYAYWFEGVYIDKRHFFPQFAASLPGYLDAYPEYLMPEDQKLALIQDRRGAVAGRKLAARYGWRLGDAIVLKGTYFPGEYRLVLRAIYKGRDPSADETLLFFHWDYLNETLKKIAPDMADKVGWFLVQVARPDLTAPVSGKIDVAFKNSLAETLTETEAAFNLSFVEMTSAILVHPGGLLAGHRGDLRRPGQPPGHERPGTSGGGRGAEDHGVQGPPPGGPHPGGIPHLVPGGGPAGPGLELPGGEIFSPGRDQYFTMVVTRTTAGWIWRSSWP
jgi:hypothetical protein